MIDSPEAASHDLIRGHDDDEGMGINIVHNKFQFADLRCTDRNENYISFAARVCPLSMQKRDATVHFINNALGNFFVFI